jgi:hypothetical protein
MTGTQATATARPDLPELPLEAWEPTKTTLHLWAQIVGKVKLAATAPRNHWWNVPLYLDVRGLTTRRLHHGQVSFQIDFDFVDHRLVVATNRVQEGRFRSETGCRWPHSTASSTSCSTNSMWTSPSARTPTVCR